jgi:uncharacterized membrane protein
MMKVTVLAALVVALSAGGAYALFGMSKCEKVKAVGGVVTIPLARVSDGKAHFYNYESGGKEIVFFVVKGSDGSLKVAFDACDVCYQEKKGYVQKGSDMICKNCNRKFATDRIGPHAVGGCNPSHLPHRQSGDAIQIAVDDLKAGARFF